MKGVEEGGKSCQEAHDEPERERFREDREVNVRGREVTKTIQNIP